MYSSECKWGESGREKQKPEQGKDGWRGWDQFINESTHSFFGSVSRERVVASGCVSCTARAVCRVLAQWGRSEIFTAGDQCISDVVWSFESLKGPRLTSCMIPNTPRGLPPRLIYPKRRAYSGQGRDGVFYSSLAKELTARAVKQQTRLQRNEIRLDKDTQEGGPCCMVRIISCLIGRDCQGGLSPTPPFLFASRCD